MQKQANSTVNLLFKTEVVGGKPRIFWNATSDDPPERGKPANTRKNKTTFNQEPFASQKANSTSSKEAPKPRVGRQAVAQNKNQAGADRFASLPRARPAKPAEDDDSVTLTKTQLNALLASLVKGALPSENDGVDMGRADRRNLRATKANDSADSALGPDSDEELALNAGRERGPAKARSQSLNQKKVVNGKAGGTRQEENIFALLNRANDHQVKPKRVVLASDTNQRIAGTEPDVSEGTGAAWKRPARTVREQQLLDKKKRRQLEFEAQFEGVDIRQLAAEKTAPRGKHKVEKPAPAVQHFHQDYSDDDGDGDEEQKWYSKVPVPKEVRIVGPDSASTAKSGPSFREFVHEPAPVPVPAPVLVQPVSGPMSLAEKKREKWAAEQRELSKLGVAAYNPFGRPGGGAPLSSVDFDTSPTHAVTHTEQNIGNKTQAAAQDGLFKTLMNSDITLKANRERERQKWLAELAEQQQQQQQQQRNVENTVGKPTPSFAEPASSRNDASFTRGFGLASLMDNGIASEQEERRRKQLAHQAAIAAQIEERARLRKMERQSQMLADMNDDVRIRQQMDAEERAAQNDLARQRAKEQQRETNFNNLQNTLEQERVVKELLRRNDPAAESELARLKASVVTARSEAAVQTNSADLRATRLPQEHTKRDLPGRDSPEIMFNSANEKRRLAEDKVKNSNLNQNQNQKPKSKLPQPPKKNNLVSEKAQRDARKPPPAVRNRLADATIGNVLDDLGWNDRQKKLQNARGAPTRAVAAPEPTPAAPVPRQKPKAEPRLSERHKQTPPSPPPPPARTPPPMSPPVPALRRRMDTHFQAAPHDPAEFSNELQYELSEVNAVKPTKRSDEPYRDKKLQLQEDDQFAPFVRTSEFLDPAHALSSTEISREPSSVERARRSYEKQLNPAARSDNLPPRRDKKPFASRPLIRGSLVNDADRPLAAALNANDTSTERSLAASADASRLLVQIKRGLVRRQRELEVTMPNVDSTDD